MITKFPSPFPKKTKIHIAKSEGEFAKENLPELQHGINLIAGKNTPVQAVKDGTIFKIKTDSKKYGLNKKLKDQANYVVMDHGDETYTEYAHLGRKVPVRIGQKVKVGETIGYTGLSGYMKTPNLYLNFFKIEKGKPTSLQFEIRKPKFQEDLAKIIGMIFILSIIAIAILFSRFTGSIIGERTSNLYGLILIAIAIISGTTWIILKRRQYKPKPVK